MSIQLLTTLAAFQVLAQPSQAAQAFLASSAFSLPKLFKSSPFCVHLQRMDSLDLTLRLGMSSNEDEQPQLPPILNANGASNMTQGAFGSGVSGNVYAGQYSGISITEFQRSVSLAHTNRREHVLPPPTEMKEYCVINVSNRLAKVGGSRRRKVTLSQRPVPEADENRSCTNFNCRVKETPMWRRGPLGSKTLCNACGIKYRKLKLKEEQGEGAAEGA